MANKSIIYGKTILLGITGSIAAFKTPLLVRELVKKGANIHVLLTPSATQFVTPLTLANVSRNKVIVDMFDEESQTSGAWHIELAHKCDAMLIAPCSATTLGKIANSICDTPLVSVAIALPSSIPLIISPAMDSTMWMHPATQRSLDLVKSDGAIVLPPVDGDLSSGFVGPGRFPDIPDIVSFLENSLINWGEKKRYNSSLDYSMQHDSIKSNFEREQELLNNPIESVSESVSKDKFNAELELEQLKKKL